MGICVFSTLGLLWIVVLQTFAHTFLCGFSVLISPKNGISLCSLIIVNALGTTRMFSKQLHCCTLLPGMYKASTFCTVSLTLSNVHLFDCVAPDGF